MALTLPSSEPNRSFRPTSGDNIIVVLGPTGVGKSYFVKAATGDESIRLGDGLASGERTSQRGGYGD